MESHRIASADGTSLRMVTWGSGGRDVLLVHGLAEHAGRYEHVAAALVAAGHRVTMVELRGHGQSEGKRGHTASWRRYCEDVWAAAATIPGSYAIVAHSMGGLVTLDALRELVRQPVIGVVVSNPLLGLGFEPPKVKAMASGLLSRLVPSLSLKNELDRSNLSHDPEVIRRYESDPLVFGTITPRWFVEMRGAMARVHDAAPRYNTPLLGLIGEGDHLTNPPAGIDFVGRYGGPKTLRRYPGLYHELFNELEKAEILAEVTTWLKTLSWDA